MQKLTLIAGTDLELDELKRDFVLLGFPVSSTQATVYSALEKIPPDNMQTGTIIVEISPTVRGAWDAARQIRRLCPNATLVCAYRGQPEAAMHDQMLELAKELKATLFLYTTTAAKDIAQFIPKATAVEKEPSA